MTKISHSGLALNDLVGPECLLHYPLARLFRKRRTSYARAARPQDCHCRDVPEHAPEWATGRYRPASSTAHCNTASSLSAGASKPKVLSGR
jgi:hypothetical protein